MRQRLVGVLGGALLLSACATARGPDEAPTPAPAPPGPAQPGAPAAPANFSSLTGWAEADHAEAFAAYRATCGVAKAPAEAEICRRARAHTRLESPEARAFFEDNFRLETVPGEGVLTAYYAPEYTGRRAPDAEYSAPVRPKPANHAALSGRADRAAIEATPPTEVLAWMRPEELFFLQIQGSGVLTFPDGERVKVLFAAHNDLPFSGIANPMRDRGLLAANNTSGEAIRAWLAARRGPEADAIMRLNRRYVWFRLEPDDGLHPVGAAGIPLPPDHAIAVDLSQHRVGELFWIDAVAPILTGAFPTYRRLAMALDTGGAIKGQVRADLYLGSGPEAGVEAGRVRHTLRMIRLAPRVGPDPSR
ncbi:MltA domain-containing protein [Phenylobacterium sp.]|uniref:MltA domain-containing protein n=1 Tax=Phenylobacterium sp. TaxID=1871053 RepID=UPI002731EB57|nr:MltA domain-containing protein [Phenylobacterium sp.]MDP1873815.1 MltA domain-containing protein [Phenylobacterium sp.]MDP3490919.1 MltA domain-containing protein [Phenylobacterium sp.]